MMKAGELEIIKIKGEGSISVIPLLQSGKYYCYLTKGANETLPQFKERAEKVADRLQWLIDQGGNDELDSDASKDRDRR